MAKRGFFDGLLAGALVGVFAGVWLLTDKGGKREMGMLKKGKVMGRKAVRLLADTRDAMGEVRGVIQKRFRH